MSFPPPRRFFSAAPPRRESYSSRSSASHCGGKFAARFEGLSRGERESPVQVHPNSPRASIPSAAWASFFRRGRRPSRPARTMSRRRPKGEAVYRSSAERPLRRNKVVSSLMARSIREEKLRSVSSRCPSADTVDPDLLTHLSTDSRISGSHAPRPLEPAPPGISRRFELLDRSRPSGHYLAVAKSRGRIDHSAHTIARGRYWHPVTRRFLRIDT